MKNHIVVNVCLVLSMLFVLYFTLRSHPDLGIGDPGARINITPFESITFDPVKGLAFNVIGNILLFVPFGLSVAFKVKGKFRLFKVVFWGGLFSFSIEMIQLFLPNRWTDIDDIILNTTGTFLGYLLFLMAQVIVPKK
ncbi:MAG: VanZ family protein [Bacillus sp. (in: firmicutes)]